MLLTTSCSHTNILISQQSTVSLIWTNVLNHLDNLPLNNENS